MFAAAGPEGSRAGTDRVTEGGAATAHSSTDSVPDRAGIVFCHPVFLGISLDGSADITNRVILPLAAIETMSVLATVEATRSAEDPDCDMDWWRRPAERRAQQCRL